VYKRQGKGRVLQSTELQPVLNELGIPPDFSGADPKHILWTHRSNRECEIYFVCNQAEQVAAITPVFRVSGKLPEFWDAVSGCMVKAAAFAPTEGGTRVPLELGPRGSLFVVFREPVGSTPAVTQVTRDGRVILSTAAKATEAASGTDTRNAVNNFTMAGWVKPAADITLPAETNSGVFLHVARNDAVFPSHGASAFSDLTHACAGISAGRNGVCVYEHSSDYFAPVLAHRAPLTNWTHIAVVYQDGAPSLYLDGTLAHKGLKSRFNVHSGLSVEPSGGGNFKGELSGLRDFGRPLGAAEVAELAKAKPTAGSALSAIIVARAGKGSLEAEVPASGSYAVKFSNGQSRTFEVPPLPPPREISGPWELRFPAQMDLPERVRLDRLISLTEHTNEAIRYFSGTAAYERTFDLPADRLASGQRLLLDLGRVEALAEVNLNGKNLGVLWKPPFLLEVTDAARPGLNRLEVRVTGTWRNRLIGDAKSPDGFPSAGDRTGGPPQFKPFLGVKLNLRPDETPAPFGLLGPVQLRNTQRVSLSP